MLQGLTGGPTDTNLQAAASNPLHSHPSLCSGPTPNLPEAATGASPLPTPPDSPRRHPTQTSLLTIFKHCEPSQTPRELLYFIPPNID